MKKVKSLDRNQGSGKLLSSEMIELKMSIRKRKKRIMKERTVKIGLLLTILLIGSLSLAFTTTAANESKNDKLAGTTDASETQTIDWWPMFHHDLTHTGYSDSKAPKTNQTLWTYTTGNTTYSSPAVSDGKVYVGSYDRKVYCLNALTGAHIWNYTTGNSVYASPAVSDGKVYVGSYDNKVYCLDASTGSLIWSYLTGGLVRSSPAVADDKVYVGSFDNGVYAFGVHDVAVTNVASSKDGCLPMPTVGGGFNATINVTVANQGGYTETFNVTAYANTTIIETKEVTLAIGNFTTLTFTWNTTDFAKGNYTISAYAEPVPGETNTADNTLVGGHITVTIPGDINGNFIVNILDAILLSNAYLATPGKSNWNPNADINGDNIVNILDAILLSNHYLQHYP
jgi:hypothetical protein